MRLLDHPNVVTLKHCFFSTTEKEDLYLNLVLEYVPETVYRVIKHYNKMGQRMPLIYVKLYMYQVGQQATLACMEYSIAYTFSLCKKYQPSLNRLPNYFIQSSMNYLSMQSVDA